MSTVVQLTPYREIAAIDEHESALPMFDRNAPCPKCGADSKQVVARWLPAERHWFNAPTPERMKRYCQCCGAVFYQRPLDADGGLR